MDTDWAASVIAQQEVMLAGTGAGRGVVQELPAGG